MKTVLCYLPIISLILFSHSVSTGLSLDQEITDTFQKSDSNDPRLFSPEVPDVKSKNDHVHFDEEGPTVVLSSSVHSEGKRTRTDFIIQ